MKKKNVLLTGLMIGSLLIAGCSSSEANYVVNKETEPEKDELVLEFKKQMEETIEQTKLENEEEEEEVEKEKEKEEEVYDVDNVDNVDNVDEVEDVDSADEVIENIKVSDDKVEQVSETDKKETPKKSNTEIAKEVLEGKWGSGSERKRRLTESGYDVGLIQSEVNALTPKPEPTPVPKPVSPSESTGVTQTSAPAQNSAPAKQATGTIVVHGQTFHLGKTFSNSYDAQQYIDAAPNSNIAVEWGPLNVNNGYGAKIAGHAPGVFGSLQGRVGIGTKISVVDFNGNQRTYTVNDIAIQGGQEVGLNNDVKRIADKTNYNESIILQFCIKGVNHLYYAE